jgi:hypothetical protein
MDELKSADRRDVELLTCLEMSAEVGALNAANGARGNKARPAMAARRMKRLRRHLKTEV